MNFQKLLALILAIIMVTSLFSACSNDTSDDPNNEESNSQIAGEEQNTNEFVPVLRFVVASDTHLTTNSKDIEGQRLVKLFETAYAYSEAQTDYNELDAVLFVGDITNDGSKNSLNRFFKTVKENLKGKTISKSVMGNHEFNFFKAYPTLSATQIEESTTEAFLDASNYETPDHHFTLNGFHFIMVSPSGKGAEYNKTKQDWLKAELEIAAADDPTGKKPIFVFQHVPVSATTIGSYNKWGSSALKTILNAYPQVVDFAGHTHRSLQDPRSIYQEKFTALNTGGMMKLTFEIPGIDMTKLNDALGLNSDGTYVNAKDKNGGEYYIIEVSADNVIKVQGYHVEKNKFIITPYEFTVGDVSEFKYTTERANTCAAPAFSADATITLDKVDSTSAQITFPQATCPDYLNHYIIDVYKGEELISTEYRFSNNDLDPVPETRTVPISNLKASTEYKVIVTPVNTWNKSGSPLEITFSTK